MRGRPRKYETDAAKKRARREQRRLQPPTKVYIGKAMNFWIERKETTGIKTDAAFAKCLLDMLVSHVYLTSTISTYFNRMTTNTMLRFTCNRCGGIYYIRTSLGFAISVDCPEWENGASASGGSALNAVIIAVA